MIYFGTVCLGVEEWLNFYSTLVRITMRIGPAINFLFHFLQYMILSVYCSMKLKLKERDNGAEKECWRK